MFSLPPNVPFGRIHVLDSARLRHRMLYFNKLLVLLGRHSRVPNRRCPYGLQRQADEDVSVEYHLLGHFQRHDGIYVRFLGRTLVDCWYILRIDHFLRVC